MTPEDKREREARLRQLPAAMRELRQWLVWRSEKVAGKDKPAKVPYYVSGRRRKGVQGSVEDRQELQTFEVALSELRAGNWSGLGFAFLPGDGLIGVDIDGAVDEATGEISERCQAIVRACASYTEWSPSRRGVHIICAGETKTFKDNSIGLEVFCNAQFFTCTGERWEDQPHEVAPMDEQTLRRLQATVRKAKKDASPAPAQPAQGGGPAAQASAPPVPPAGAPAPGKGEDFRRVNEVALSRLDAWVPVLLPAARRYDDGRWRVTSADLGRQLQEDLSFSSLGIRDWGYSDMEAREGKRTPIDVVMEVRSLKAKDAMLWLADLLGVPVRKPAPAAAPPGAAKAGKSTPLAGSAEGEEEKADDWRRQLLYANTGYRDCRENVFVCLTHHEALKGLVGYDEFAHRVMKLRAPPWDSEPGEWNTQDDYLLGFWLARHMKMVVRSETTLMAGVAMAAFANRFHPVHDYLDALAPWDGVERLGHWLSECLGAEEGDYTRLVGSWFLMGMVKRVREPGCQMDYMVVLEGLQGKQKSTALRTLVGNDDWFADTPIRIGDKDALLSLAGKLLYEVGELDAFNKAEVTAVKQYISSRVDRVREPFARRPADRPRSGVFAGTTNQSEYFKDPTGARRFWPVACDREVNLKLLAEWRDQLFAEAKHRLASADPEQRRYWPSREETEKWLVPQQERREIVDPWFERLAVWLDSDHEIDHVPVKLTKSFTAAELLVKALNVPMDRIDGGRQMATRVGIAMHKLGWEKRRDSDGPRLYRYWRPGGKTKAQGPAETGGRAPASDGVPTEVFGDD